jgi:hypothetical protein
MYPDKDVAAAVCAYAAGKLDDATKSLLKSKAPKEVVNSLRENMTAVANVFKDAQGSLTPQGVRTADDKFERVRALDQGIMPPNVESYYGKTMRDALALWYFKAAEPTLKNETSLLTTYLLCSAGSKHRPGDSNIISCLDKTEPKLLGSLENGGRCEDARRIVDEGRKEGALFETARKFVADNSCP